MPAAAARGVRVLFSDKGVLADDVIRTLVAAEPAAVRWSWPPPTALWPTRSAPRGAHPVPSAVLLTRLGRV